MKPQHTPVFETNQIPAHSQQQIGKEKCFDDSEIHSEIPYIPARNSSNKNHLLLWAIVERHPKTVVNPVFSHSIDPEISARKRVH